MYTSLIIVVDSLHYPLEKNHTQAMYQRILGNSVLQTRSRHLLSFGVWNNLESFIKRGGHSGRNRETHWTLGVAEASLYTCPGCRRIFNFLLISMFVIFGFTCISYQYQYCISISYVCSCILWVSIKVQCSKTKRLTVPSRLYMLLWVYFSLLLWIFFPRT